MLTILRSQQLGYLAQLSLLTHYGGQFTFSTQLLTQNYLLFCNRAQFNRRQDFNKTYALLCYRAHLNQPQVVLSQPSPYTVKSCRFSCLNVDQMLTLLRTDSFWSYSLAYVRIVRIIRKRHKGIPSVENKTWKLKISLFLGKT